MCVCTHACVYMCARVFMCVCMWHLCVVCACVCGARICVCVCLVICTCICVCGVHVCGTYACVRVYACVCRCACVHVFLCVAPWKCFQASSSSSCLSLTSISSKRVPWPPYLSETVSALQFPSLLALSLGSFSLFLSSLALLQACEARDVPVLVTAALLAQRQHLRQSGH